MKMSDSESAWNCLQGEAIKEEAGDNIGGPLSQNPIFSGQPFIVAGLS